jgi:methionyl-tRNA synthetase
VLDRGGYIFKRSYEGWYSTIDECFYNDYEIMNHKLDDKIKVLNILCLSNIFFLIFDC